MTRFVSILSSCVMALVYSGCAESEFASGSKTKVVNDKGDDQEPAKLMRVSYGQDAKPQTADYLFVFDNSASMTTYVTKVAAGLTSISKDVFPESSRIAVMTTMAAADPLASSLSTHADIVKYACIDKEPGFLSLVDRAAVQAFKSCSGVPATLSAKYSKELCDAKWFDPFAVNKSGDRCFAAALQNPFHPVGCEPGILAVEQMIKRQKGAPLFRDGAVANIIFVSDEQAQCKAAETRGDRSKATETAERIKAAIQQNSKVAAISINGIVPPASKTNAVPTDVLPYESLIKAAKGQWFDISDTKSDYNAIVKQLIETKVDAGPAEFTVPESATEVSSVEVDGVATSDFEFDADSHKVILKGLDPSKKVSIEIKYLSR